MLSSIDDIFSQNFPKLNLKVAKNFIRDHYTRTHGHSPDSMIIIIDEISKITKSRRENVHDEATFISHALSSVLSQVHRVPIVGFVTSLDTAFIGGLTNSERNVYWTGFHGVYDDIKYEGKENDPYIKCLQVYDIPF